MTDNRKKRLSMLDTLAASGGGASAAPMMTTNRALRSARDAVDSHRVWDLDPGTIIDDRTRDRLDAADVADLRASIEASGQSVPILVRRHPTEEGNYLLVYGRRRLEAIRLSDKVEKVRALVASLDDRAAVTAQISENVARRDLSYIEKALFAQDLVNGGFGNQNQVAEVLAIPKSAVSMALSIASAVGRELAEAIGAAHGVGRPRWETMARALEAAPEGRTELIREAEEVHLAAGRDALVGDSNTEDVSLAAFEAVMRHLTPSPQPPASRLDASQALLIEGRRVGRVKRTAKGLAIEVADEAFVDWLEAEAGPLISELHARWKASIED